MNCRGQCAREAGGGMAKRTFEAWAREVQKYETTAEFQLIELSGMDKLIEINRN